MKSFEVKALGLEEMTSVEQSQTNGGRKYYVTNSGNPVIYLVCACGNLVEMVKDIFTDTEDEVIEL